ncbi:hypothetical protein P3X46_019123 [Hevea brasiliensis]|uniref:Uncharacterized protein n=1 Tax=Hevea brasiliensis TaxID=3981 RepID=A0ABQ9LU76_HEVBR|nr:hypothetical protein P3X46_019123 [Hevea brasiliensis]
MSTPQPTLSNILASILDRNRLIEPNLFDWLRNLKLVLNLEHIGYVLDSNVPSPLPREATQEEHETLDKWKEHDMRASEILLHLQELYGEHSRNARYEISRQLFRMRMYEGQNVEDHVHKMIWLIEQLEHLDFNVDFQLQMDLILQSLPESFGNFVTNFHMTKQECTLVGLLNMLVIAQKNMPGNKGKEVALITSSFARKSNKKKGNKKKKPQIPGPSKKIAKQKGKTKADGGKGKCFHC